MSLSSARLRWRHSWQLIRDRRPGVRFYETYVAHRKERASTANRVIVVAVAVLFILLGIIALVAPGPGLVGIALGLGLISRESKRLARALDRIEIYWRSVVLRFRRRRSDAQ